MNRVQETADRMALRGAEIQLLDLPLDRPRPPSPPRCATLELLMLPDRLRASLLSAPRRSPGARDPADREVSSILPWIAGFAALLHRYTGEERIHLGVESGKPRLAGFEGVVGLGCDLAGNPSFGELLDQVERALSGVAAQNGYPQGAFQVMVRVHPSVPCDGSGPTRAGRVEDAPHGCDLALELGDHPEGPEVGLRYSADLFDPATAARMAGHLGVLLDAAASNPDLRLSDLPLLTEAESHRLLVEWNDPREYAQEKGLHQLFEEQVRRSPKAVALTFEGESVTYAVLNGRSNRIAHALARLGVKPRQAVAAMIENGPRQVAAVLGVLKAGGVFACLDANYPTKRLLDILEEAGTTLLVAESAALARHPEVLQTFAGKGGAVLELDVPGVAPRYGTDLLSECDDADPVWSLAPEDPAYVVYTSGSTGRPKGIVQSHRSFCQFIEWQSRQFGIQGPERFAQWASIAYDASYCEIFGALGFGATLCIAPPAVRYDPPRLVEWAREQAVTILQMVPSFCKQVVEVLRSDAAHEHNGSDSLPRLRLLLLAGEILPADLAQLWFSLFRKPPALVNLYGPTECVLATFHAVDGLGPGQRSIPIGRAIDGRQILILDRHQRLCPVGVRGEIYVRSRYLTLGYFGRPEETAKRFLQNPLHDGSPDRVYRTGDTGRWLPDGTIEFFGRIDNLVKLRGMRVELGDIESALRLHPSVRDCAVLVRTLQRGRETLVAKEREAREDARPGGQQVLVAYLTSNQEVSSDELRRFLEERLPAHMVPQQFVLLTELPLNANRKLDVKALPEPSRLRPELADSYVAPRGPEEALIAEIWQEVLGIDRVGSNDGFFELGGDSLLAMQVLNRLRKATNPDLTFRHLFERQSVAGLAEIVRELGASQGTASIAPADPCRRTYPLILAQQGIWFLWKLDPESPYYTAQGTIHLRGTLDVATMKRAWQVLVERHAVLRARFSMEDGRPVQTFDEQRGADLPLVDLTHLSESERPSEMEHALRARVRRALDLEKDPLLQAQLFRLSDDRHELALTFHEIILDLWALSIMMRDLAVIYRGLVGGHHGAAPLLPDVNADVKPDVQFGDYAVWEGENVLRERLLPQEEYWRRQLAGELPVLAVPTDRPRPAVPTYRGRAKTVMLDAELSHQLRALSLQEETTLFMTLLAASSTLLHVYSGQDDLIIGAPIANRGRSETESIVGFFLNMLPLRTRLSGGTSFRDLLRQVRGTVQGALSNAEYPFVWMLEKVKAARDTSVAPVFQVMFNMLNLPYASLEEAGLRIAFVELDTGYVKYDLALYAQEHGDRIFFQIAYLTDLFDDATIERMLANFQVLLRSIITDPDARLADLKVLGEDERRTLLVDFGATDRDFGNERCLHELFEEQVRRTPDATALLFGDERLSYAALNANANRLARHLRRQGVGRETPVAVCTERSFDTLVALLGVMKAGGAYVALEPAYPLLRLQKMLEDTRPPVLVAQRRLDRFEAFEGVRVWLDEHRDGIEAESADDLPGLTRPDDLLNIVYTSSSTGRPKGALITGRAVLNRLFWMWETHPFREGDCAVLQKSYALVAATWECFGALLKGVPTVILSQAEVSDPAALWQRLLKARVSHLLASPPFLERLLDETDAHPAQSHALRLATTSASPISAALVLRWRSTFPGVPLLNLYGSTECTSNVTVYDTSEMEASARRVPVGRPLPNTRVYVLDERLDPVPIGVAGEMCVAGACLARSYLNLPDLTAERFVPNLFSGRPGDRLYRTGDLARFRADGTLELVGRRDDQVKIRGFRVELGDVEEALNRYEQVRRCAVALHGEDGDRRRLVAYAVADGPPSPVTLRRFLRERLPDYMIPSDFVFLDALPLTAAGKVDRRALPAPDDSRPRLEADYVAPRTPNEEVLAAIWSEVLKLDKIGVHDNFFDLGGHSLLATQVISRVRKTFELDIPLRALFESPTVASLAAHVAQAVNEGTAAPALTRDLIALSDEALDALILAAAKP